MKKIGLFLMSEKGYTTLKGIIDNNLHTLIDLIVYGEDKDILNDYSKEICRLCATNNLRYINRKSFTKYGGSDANMLIAISWRWLIDINKNQKLIVLHDSLLPKYRGFAPLVNALVNGEPEVGVTALYATSEYDRGDIIWQSKLKVNYPIKIAEAIQQISKCYNELLLYVLNNLKEGKEISATKQNETEASYSLWRDEEDYLIDWNLDSHQIRRIVDAVGFPYRGALTRFDDKRLRINDVEILEDVVIENRTPGKVIFYRNNKPVVVCGRGLIQINQANFDGLSETALPLKKFRIRFS